MIEDNMFLAVTLIMIIWEMRYVYGRAAARETFLFFNH